MKGINVVEAPKLKKDWVGKTLLLKEHYELGGLTPLPGSLLLIFRRMNAMETINSAQDVSFLGSARILKCSWVCPACKATHIGYLPESWIDNRKAYFVESF